MIKFCLMNALFHRECFIVELFWRFDIMKNLHEDLSETLSETLSENSWRRPHISASNCKNPANKFQSLWTSESEEPIWWKLFCNSGDGRAVGQWIPMSAGSQVWNLQCGLHCGFHCGFHYGSHFPAVCGIMMNAFPNRNYAFQQHTIWNNTDLELVEPGGTSWGPEETVRSTGSTACQRCLSL